MQTTVRFIGLAEAENELRVLGHLVSPSWLHEVAAYCNDFRESLQEQRFPPSIGCTEFQVVATSVYPFVYPQTTPTGAQLARARPRYAKP
jgi:hypothetical protein